MDHRAVIAWERRMREEEGKEGDDRAPAPGRALGLFAHASSGLAWWSKTRCVMSSGRPSIARKG